MHKIIALLLMLSVTVPVIAEEDKWCLFCGENDWSLSGGAGVDINGDYRAVTLSGNWLPQKRSLGTGVIVYGELGQYDYREDSGGAITIGVEPVLTYRGFYVGAGLGLGNTTPNLGTVWNFSTVGGYRHTFENDMFVDVNVRHRSHAARAGIEEGKNNGGVTLVNFQVGVRF